MSWKHLFARKKLEVLLDEMAGEHRLRRVLGPVALSSLGIGAIIGTGIFVLTGLAARNYAGPGLMLSFVIGGLACAMAALCYAEFASMAPVAGSAYTYAYTTLGELVAWIIGWDLILEYAMGSATVANGWSSYFLKFLGLFKNPATGKALISIPLWLTMDPFSAAEQHVDYQTADMVHIAVAMSPVDARTSESNLAKPADPALREFTVLDEKGVKHVRAGRALPLDPSSGIHKVEEIYIQFNDDSLAAVRALHGPKAPESLDRVRHSLESGLQFEPTKDPAAKLREVRDGNAQGHEAYNTTPLVLGGLHLTCNVIAIAITAVITIVLVIGIRESAGFNGLMVLVKVAAVIFVIVAGIRYVDASNWSPFLPYGWTGVLSAAGVIFFAYIGFDSVSTHAEEARNPRRDVPIGIISSLLVCTVLYIAVAAVITGMVPYPQIPLNAPIAGAFEQKGYATASLIITIGALTGITSVLLVMLLSQPRVLLAMARDGLLPQGFFGAVHPRFRTPHKSTILTGLFCAVCSSFLPLEALGHMVSIGTLFAFVVVCAAVWIMRYTNPHAERPFRTPFLPAVAFLGIVLCLTMMVSLGWQNWVRLFGWLGIGMVIYFLYSRRHSHLGKELRGEITRRGISPAGMPLDGPRDEK